MFKPRNRRLSMQRCLARLLAFLLVVVPLIADPQAPVAPPAAPASPQTPAPAPAPTAAPAPLPVIQGLKVIPLAGKGEMNDLERKIMAPVVVEVLDQNDRPLEGAEVVFRFPISGPTAVFAGGKSSQTLRTNSQGQAAAVNWMANDQVGRFDVHVAASYGNQVGEVTFSMGNAQRVTQKDGREKRGWFSPLWVKVAVIGGGAALAVGIILLTRGGSHSTSSGSTVTITPGSPSVGGPQ
jgi:hypothetical protein